MHYTENYSNYYPKKKLRTMGHITPSMDYYPRKFQIVDTDPPYIYIYVYIHTYIYVYIVCKTRHFFKNSDISNLTNLQRTVTNKMCQEVYTTRIITG